MSNIEETSVPTPDPPAAAPPGLILVSIALALPVIAGIAQCFITSFPLATGVSIATVVVSSLLVAIDASLVSKLDSKNQPRQSAVVLFLGMCGLWIVVYPLAFFQRRKFGGPNLGYLSIVVALFFLLAPMLVAMMLPASLPTCSSRDVQQVVQKLIRGSSLGPTMKSIDDYRELSYNDQTKIREGECTVHTYNNTDIAVQYFVEWQDQEKGLFQVRLAQPDLPTCTSAEVITLLEQVIRSTPQGATIKTIDGHRELSFDPVTNIRQGECIIHTQSGDETVPFVVEWQDAAKGMFQVRTVPGKEP